MDEGTIKEFWNTHPCGEKLIDELKDDYENFFRRYDAFRYSHESHIPRCLDQIDFKNKKVLEIGLGQGADSEQIITSTSGSILPGVPVTPTPAG